MEVITGIGVVIPLYNRAHAIQATLASVVAQTRLPDKLVIVDDGSEDGSADAAERWLRTARPGVDWEVIRAPHRQAAAARNTGFEQVRHLTQVVFLDSDDCWPEDFLARSGRLLDASAGAVAVSTDRLIEGPDSRYINPDLCGLAEDPELWLIANDAGIASCSLLCSRAVQTAGAWNEEIDAGEDFLLFAAIARQGAWLHAPGQPVRFNRRMDQASGDQGNLSRSLPRKHWEWAVLAENLLDESAESAPDRRQALRRAVAGRWVSAGNHFVRKRLFGLARDAYMRAMELGYDPVSVRARALASRLLSPFGHPSALADQARLKRHGN